MVIPLYFVPLLSSLPTSMRKQHTSRQHSIQGSIQGDWHGSARPSTSTSVDWESSDPLQPDDSGSVYFDGMAHDQLPDYPPKASPNFRVHLILPLSARL